MSSDEMIQRRLDRYVATSLGISTELLDQHPYELDEESGTPSTGFQWRIVWEDAPPPGVSVNGSPGSLWSDIAPADWE